MNRKSENRTDGAASRPCHCGMGAKRVPGFSEDTVFLFFYHLLFGMISFLAEELPLAALPIIFRCAFETRIFY
jgi:hypothetical protein